jgi:hypothetical protein
VQPPKEWEHNYPSFPPNHDRCGCKGLRGQIRNAHYRWHHLEHYCGYTRAQHVTCDQMAVYIAQAPDLLEP